MHFTLAMLLLMHGMEITGIIFIVQGLLPDFLECEMHVWTNMSFATLMVFTPRKPVFKIAIFRSLCD